MQIGNNTSKSKSVDSEQDSIEYWRNGEFCSINWRQYSKEHTEIREDFWVPHQVRDEDVSIKEEKKRANVATRRKTKPIVVLALIWIVVA